MDNTDLLIAEEAVNCIAQRGAFLVTKNNAMLIGWAMAGYMWRKPTLLVAVRLSRHSHSIIERTGEFHVCIPFAGQMEDELEFCGKKSGRDINKLKDLEFTMIPGNNIETPTINGCEYYLECRVLLDATQDLNKTDKDVVAKFYSKGDPHTMYFAEIVSSRKVSNTI